MPRLPKSREKGSNFGLYLPDPPDTEAVATYGATAAAFADAEAAYTPTQARGMRTAFDAIQAECDEDAPNPGGAERAYAAVDAFVKLVGLDDPNVGYMRRFVAFFLDDTLDD